MTLEQYSYVFEILASVAVVISLIFVGVQLARANRESRNATLQAAMFREMDNSFQAQTWEARDSTMPALVRLPIFPHWRNALSGRNHSSEFLSYLERLAQDQGNEE